MESTLANNLVNNALSSLAESVYDNQPIASATNDTRSEAVAQDFESIFLSLLLKEMRGSLLEGGFFGNEGSDTFGAMFDLFIGKHMSQSSPLGLADMVNTYLQRETAPPQSPTTEAQTSTVSYPA